jgi:transcriptional regulator with XRE-family HTH domain
MDYKMMGKRIREYRSKTSKTQEKFAESIGLSAEYISQLETGVRSPSLETIVKIANALNVPVDYLVSDSLIIDENEKINEILVLLKGRTSEELSFAADIIRTMFSHVKNNSIS